MRESVLSRLLVAGRSSDDNEERAASFSTSQEGWYRRFEHEPLVRPRPTREPTSPASYSSLTGTVFRANHFPEVTNVVYRLALPTLFYRLETV